MAIEYKRFIYWLDGHEPDGQRRRGAEVHLLRQYTTQRLSDYRQMHHELKKTFPQSKESDVECHQVMRSEDYASWTLLIWRGWLAKKQYPGYIECLEQEYSYMGDIS